ncbi:MULTISPECIES: alpha/beta hydrolase [Tessaracoccus]|uniref:alpha/beta hydrolase n=1 Tax=Tessaracoccus TaxID=72763 RepID=UPI00099C2E58|nr:MULTISPECIES: alpha/beta hydrolase [Tessaracoccus]AQX17335.1 hypothetical protein BKM78_14340 [Tessaracoccus sp. T2.5-30]
MSLNDDHLIFTVAPEVTRTAVRFMNRYGIEIAADLYTTRDLDESATHAALVIGPPHGGVKEQGPGVYANELARRGFVALAFDPSYNGESGGQPRHVTSPEIFAEDFSAGVDFLGTLRYVDRERIGVIGICGSGGFALNAAAIDPRIKAVATSAVVDISRLSRNSIADTVSDGQVRENLKVIAAQRWADVDAGEPALTPVFPDEFEPEKVDPMTAEFHEFYVTDRGRHLRSIGGFTVTSGAAHAYAAEVRHVSDISPRPVLLITGDKSFSSWFNEHLYEVAAEPKELHWVPGARHIDMYDRVDLIPFDKLEAYFAEHLAPGAGQAGA